MRRRVLLDMTPFIGATILLAAPVAAQTEGKSTLEEVIVTAQKREQNMQQVGIAVTAFSGKDLEHLHLSDAQDLADQVVGLNLETPGGPANTTLTLRGVGQRDISTNVESAAIMYRDNAYAPILVTASMPMYDIDRVEVLKGPQGTLFGRNATGGLIHVLSKRPTEDFEGYLKARGGEYNQLGFDGAVSGGMTETLAGRLSFYTDRHDGWVENTLPGQRDGNSLESYSTRGQLSYQPTDDLDMLLIGYYNKQSGSTSAHQQRRVILDQNGLEIAPPSAQAYVDWCAGLDVNGVRGLLGLPVTPPDPGSPNGNCYFLDDGDPFRQPFNGNDDRYLNEYWGTTASIDYRFDNGLMFTSITDYQNVKANFRNEPDGSPLLVTRFGTTTDADVLAQELRLAGDADRTRWVVGLYYLNIDQTGSSEFAETDNLPAILFSSTNDYAQKTESVAAFGQVEYDIADQWMVLAGARWTEDSKDMTYVSSCAGNALLQAVAHVDVCNIVAGLFPTSIQFNGVDDDFSFSKGDWSGKLEADYKPSSDQLFYASVSRGIKSGGYNHTAIILYGSDVAQYEGETLVAYEVGSKSTLFNGTTRLNTAVYYYDYADFQNFLIVDGFLRTINVDSTVKGVDLELATSPWRGWHLQFGANYLDTESEVPLPRGGTRKDVNPGSPEWSLSALARYEWEMPGGTVALQTDWAYKGERSTNGLDNPVIRAASFVRGNVSLGYTSAGGQWSGSVFVNNVTNEQVNLLNISNPTLNGNYAQVFDKPRWVGGNIQYRW